MQRIRELRYWLLAGLLVVAGLLLVGCNGDDDDNEILRTAVLSGEQEVPPKVTLASGSGSVLIQDDRDEVTATLQTSGTFTSTVTEAHIHFGAPGENGPVLFTLYDREVNGEFQPVIIRSFRSNDLEPQPPGSPIANFGQAIDAIIAGNTYFNVHTVNNPGGEIRGQIGVDVRVADLRGANNVPPTTSTATADAVVVVAADRSRIGVGLTTQGTFTSAVTAVHIHYGAPGQTGPNLFTIYDSNTDGTFDPPLTETLTSADFATQPPGSPVTTYNQAIEAILNGNAYVVIETVNNPDGEIRGQLLRQQQL